MAGTLALVGGGEWRDGTRDLDARLLETSGGTEVLVLPTAAAYEHPDRVVEGATAHFAKLGAKVRGAARCCTGRRRRAPDIAETVRDARFVYFADGSPLHLRSVLKGSALFDALLAAYRSGAVLAASGAGRDGALRPDGRPPRRRVHRRARRRGGRRGLPVPRHRGGPPPRAVDRPAPGGRGPRRASTRRPRSCDARTRTGPSPAPARSPSIATGPPPTPRRAPPTSRSRRPDRARTGGSAGYDSVIVILLISTFCVGAPSPVDGAKRVDLLRHADPARHTAEAARSRWAGSRPGCR